MLSYLNNTNVKTDKARYFISLLYNLNILISSCNIFLK